MYGDVDEGGIVVQPHKLAEANASSNLWRHRVAVYEDIYEDDPVERAYLAAVLRHEIEHAKQRGAAKEAFGLYEIVDIVCTEAADGDNARYRDLINASPIEADANAAAAQHVRKRYGRAVRELAAGADHYLVDANADPGSPQTLVERTLNTYGSWTMSATSRRTSRRGRPSSRSSTTASSCSTARSALNGSSASTDARARERVRGGRPRG